MVSDSKYKRRWFYRKRPVVCHCLACPARTARFQAFSPYQAATLKHDRERLLWLCILRLKCMQWYPGGGAFALFFHPHPREFATQNKKSASSRGLARGGGGGGWTQLELPANPISIQFLIVQLTQNGLNQTPGGWGGGGHLGQYLPGMCRWPLRAPTPL